MNIWLQTYFQIMYRNIDKELINRNGPTLAPEIPRTERFCHSPTFPLRSSAHFGGFDVFFHPLSQSLSLTKKSHPIFPLRYNIIFHSPRKVVVFTASFLYSKPN